MSMADTPQVYRRGYSGAALSSPSPSVSDPGIHQAPATPHPKPILMVEVTAASVATPNAGYQYLFIDSSNHKLSRKDSTGTVTAIG